ncbi:TRAP transporter small permease [Acuticoccus sp. I52.16.1]|uniref:TRAP transporter small permease n=1 Tax=Acuticoccus sp. I52.16.1 TaxID=2928472 RepID=UPI001FD050EE|nr:TRAP transporter small permease [Acuticoccus sp. I52.16.1]UOM33305.1 TRAP transporter small permease [Acuticoccus sp. I52.16.1]
MRVWNMLWAVERNLAGVAAGLCILAMVFITVGGIFGRYVLHTDLIPGGYNLIERVLFPLIVFWALPIAHKEGLFPRFELLADLLPRRGAMAVGAAVLAVEIAVYAAILYFSGTFVAKATASGRTMQIGTDTWPLWPVAVMMPIAFLLMLVEMLRLLWSDLTALRRA